LDWEGRYVEFLLLLLLQMVVEGKRDCVLEVGAMKRTMLEMIIIIGKPLVDGQIELCVFHPLHFGSRVMLITKLTSLAMMIWRRLFHRHRKATNEEYRRGQIVECMVQCAKTT
jgi:hypothetical protein